MCLKLQYLKFSQSCTSYCLNASVFHPSFEIPVSKGGMGGKYFFLNVSNTSKKAKDYFAS